MSKSSFTEGSIFRPLIGFTVPVVLAMLLQSLYGAVDLMVVGQYAESTDVSAVSTGAQIMQTITSLPAGLAMGTTILLGQQIGENRPQDAGKTVGASIMFFAVVSAVLSALLLLNIERIAVIMNAPREAFEQTCTYIRICSAGLVFITAYNLLGSLFRGIGDSKIPLFCVAAAAVINIFADLLLVRVFHMGAAGAAIATVFSQAFSVLFSLLVIRKIPLPFLMKKSDIRADMKIIKRVSGFGLPVAMMDVLVGVSFLVILSIVNSLGLLASAGVGVAEKVCAFIMLIPGAFGQSMAAFTAQNYGAGKMDRAYRGLLYGILSSLAFGVTMGYLSFFHGDLLAGLFTKDPEVIVQAWEYLKAYAIDCLLVSFFFCMTGFFNGCGYTKFVLLQGVFGAFLIRIPVSFLMSRIRPVSLFRIGLATPASSLCQTVLCIVYFLYLRRQNERKQAGA